MTKRTKITTLLFVAGLIISSALNSQVFRFNNQSSGNAAADITKGITMDGKGNSYSIGTFSGTSTFTSTTLISAGSTDIFISQIDNIGNEIWTVQGSGAQADDGRSITTYPDGVGGVFVYATGYFRGSITFGTTSGASQTLTATAGGATDMDMFIVKYQDDGTLIWAMNCGSTAGGNLTIGFDISVNNNATVGGSPVNIWVGGSFMGTTAFGPGPALSLTSGGNQNGFLACYTDGATAPTQADWVCGMITTANNGTCQVTGVAADRFGTTYITGYWLFDQNVDFGGTFTNVNAYGNDDGFVASYAGTGATLNVYYFGQGAGGPNSGTAAKGIAVAQNGLVYVVGTFTGAALTPCNFPTTPVPSTLTSTGGVDGFIMAMNNATTNVTWLNRLGGTTDDDAQRIAVDNCGQRCYATGSFKGTGTFVSINLTAAGTADAFIADFDAGTGASLSARRMGGAGGTTVGYDIAVNSVEDVQNCGAFTCGTCTGTGGWTNLVNASAGTNDGFVSRYDHSDWPALETSGWAIYEGIAVVDCIDYGVGNMGGSNVTFGSLTPITSSATDIYLTSCDKYANFTSFVRLMSGSATESAYDMVSDGSSHYVAATVTTGASGNVVTFVGDPTDSYTASAANYGADAAVIKTDLVGTVQWGTSIRTVGSGSYANGRSVAYDASGNVYFCGHFNGTVTFYNAGGTTTGQGGNLTSNGATDIFIVKYNASGAIQWKKQIGGSGIDEANGISIDPTSAFYYVTGQVSSTVTTAQGLAHNHTATGAFSDGFVLRGNLNSSGSAVNDAFWTTASTSNRGNDVYSNSFSEVYVTGVKTNNQVYIASYDLSSTTTSPTSPAWSLISTGGGKGNDIILGSNGYVYVSGEMTSTSLTFGSLPTITSPNIYGGFVVGLASWNGMAVWESEAVTNVKFCTALAEDAGDISTDHGFIILLGGKTDIATGSHAYLQKATQEGLEFSSRLNYSVSEYSNNTPAEITASTVYPNPFSGSATLKLSSSIDPTSSAVSFVICDVTGRIVKRMDGITTQQTVVPGEELTEGIYFYQVIQSGNAISSGKIIINK